MKSFKIALVAHASPVGRKEANLAATIRWAKKAKRKGAAFAVFPELSITGHAGCAEMVDEAEPVPGGPSVAALGDVAAELGIHICAGVAEDDRGIHYNTQFIVGPDGYVGKQRKVHLSADEYFYFRGGTDLPVFGLPFGRVGIVICYDNGFPEMSRCLAVDGAELILAVHAARFGPWPRTPAGRRTARAKHLARWRRIQSCRADDNGTYVALCNTAGRSAMGIRGVEANHAGGCMLVDPDGEVAAESKARDIRDEMVIAPLDGRKVAARRRQRCFNLQTRKPEVFRVLTEPTR